MVKIDKEIIYKFIRKHLSDEQYITLWSLYTRFNPRYADVRKLESHFISKKNDKEKYCVFEFSVPAFGLMAAARKYPFYYSWAKKRGYIPLMFLGFQYDFENDRMDAYNFWEDVFEQSISTKELKDKNWVLVSYEFDHDLCKEINNNEYDNEIHLNKFIWRAYYKKIGDLTKECWTIREDIIESFNCKYSNFFSKDEKILGVSLREDFSKDGDENRNYSKKGATVYGNHPSGPGVETVISIVKEQMYVWGCEKIFLSTVMQGSLDLFKEEFGNKVVYVERERLNWKQVDKLEEEIWESSPEEIKVIYEKDNRMEMEKRRYIGYIEELIGLSKCSHLIMHVSSAAIATLTMNGGKYDDIFILEDKNSCNRY